MNLVTVYIAIDDTEDGWILTWTAPTAALHDWMREEVSNGGRSVNDGWGHVRGLPDSLTAGVWKVQMYAGSSGPDHNGEYDSWWTVHGKPEQVYAVPKKALETPEFPESEEVSKGLGAILDDLLKDLED